MSFAICARLASCEFVPPPPPGRGEERTRVCSFLFAFLFDSDNIQTDTLTGQTVCALIIARAAPAPNRARRKKRSEWLHLHFVQEDIRCLSCFVIINIRRRKHTRKRHRPRPLPGSAGQNELKSLSLLIAEFQRMEFLGDFPPRQTATGGRLGIKSNRIASTH